MPSLNTRHISRKYKALLPNYGKEFLDALISKNVDDYLMRLLGRNKPEPPLAPPLKSTNKGFASELRPRINNYYVPEEDF